MFQASAVWFSHMAKSAHTLSFPKKIMNGDSIPRKNKNYKQGIHRVRMRIIEISIIRISSYLKKKLQTLEKEPTFAAFIE